MATEKPPLDAETWEQIEGSKYWVKKTYAEKLSPYLQDLPPIFEAMQKMPDGLPSPPKQPIKLCKVLAEYATALFDIEWTCYPKTDELPTWSRNLAQRVERDIIAHALNLGRRPVGLVSRFTIGLKYHASEDQMREAVRGGLKSRVGDLKPDAPRALPRTIPRSHEPKATTPCIEEPKPDPPSPVGSRGPIWRSEETAAKPASSMLRSPDSTLRRELFNAYRRQFPDVVILDICWGAKQRYREWVRWISGEVKDGSKPDRCFRAVLSGGKRPEEYRSELRPKGWK